MKFYPPGDTRLAPRITQEGTVSEEVPNSERLHFHGLANNHQYLIQNLTPNSTTIQSSDSTPAKNIMRPTQQNGLKVLQMGVQQHAPAYNGDLLHSTCGDGDMCEWGWSIQPQVATPTMQNTPPSWAEWLPPPSNNQRPSTLDLTNEEEEIAPSFNNKAMRSSSLKTVKTPPGTPGQKKIVRFADCLGLDLVDVKLFLDEIPNVPKSAYSDLQDALDQREEFVQQKNSVNKLDRTLLPSFHQPVEMGDFFDRVNKQKVLLENCYLLDNHEVKGCILVKNLDFNKSVFIRLTYNDWESVEEFETTYVPGSCDGFSDRFQFHLKLEPSKTKIGSRVGFAVRLECLGQEYWDNNCNRNYVFHCVPAN